MNRPAAPPVGPPVRQSGSNYDGRYIGLSEAGGFNNVNCSTGLAVNLTIRDNVLTFPFRRGMTLSTTVAPDGTFAATQLIPGSRPPIALSFQGTIKGDNINASAVNPDCKYRMVLHRIG